MFRSLCCQCEKPLDNDQGVCMHCGCWINYLRDA